MGVEGLLQWGQPTIACEPLDRLDAATRRLCDRHQARADLRAVKADRTGAAIAGVAADLRACEAQLLAQHVGQPGLRRGGDGDVAAVDVEGDPVRGCAHRVAPSTRRASTVAAASRRYVALPRTSSIGVSGSRSTASIAGAGMPRR